MTLLEFLLALLGNEPADLKLQQDFRDAPLATLEQAGLGDLTADDVHDALVLVQDNQTVDFGDKSFNTGGNSITSTLVAPPAPHHEAAHLEGVSAVEYIQTYVTNDYVRDGDTTLDNATHQAIWAGDDVHQYLSTDTVVASGDGAVAAGDDIEDSQVVTGNGNIFGSGNVTGDGNTTAYGNGAATSASISGTTVSDGGALSVTGPASGTQNIVDSGNTTTTTTTYDGSFNTDVDTSFEFSEDDHSVNTVNSGNEQHVDSHNTVTTDIDV